MADVIIFDDKPRSVARELVAKIIEYHEVHAKYYGRVFSPKRGRWVIPDKEDA